jgi:hypothetical protein
VTRVALLCLAVGLVVGYLVGTLDGDPASQRTERVDPAQLRTHRGETGTKRARRVPVEHVPEPAVAGRKPVAVQPGEFEGGTDGRLVVDFGGTAIRAVRVVGRTILGQEEQEECKRAEGGTGSLDLNAGEYLVKWREPGGRDYHVSPFSIRNGHATRLRLADLSNSGDLPIPRGLCRLDVEVGALLGGPLGGARVEVTGFGMSDVQTINHSTNRFGRCRLHLIPGSYGVRVGGRVERALLKDGCTTTVTIDYRDEGELVFVPRRPGRVKLRPEGARKDAGFEPRRSRAFYVAPGRHDVLLEVIPGQGWRHLGNAEIRTGIRSKFRYELPPGGVRIEAVFDHGAFDLAKFHLEDLDDESFSLLARPNWKAVLNPGEPVSRMTATARFPSLEPGRYRVVAAARGCHPFSKEVTVAAETVVLQVLFEKDAALGDRWPPTRPRR